MSEIFGLFDATDKLNPDRVYTSEAFARLFRTIMRDGVVHNDGDELAVAPTVPAAMSVSVGTGMALVQGRYLINDAALTLAVEAADPSYPRIDRVIVRADLVGRTVHAVVKKGTAAASPAAPTLTRTAETWELSLAQVRVEAGATSIIAAKITDEQGNVGLCGVAAPVYVPSSQLEVVGAVDMQGKALTGLPAPSGSADAARKGYVDSELAAKIAGFGISQIAIDANKNWNGKNITNVGQFQANSVTTTTYTLIPDPCILYRDNRTITIESSSYTVLKTVTVPTGVSGTVAVHWDIDTRSSSRVTRSQLRKNESVIRECHLSGNEYWEGFEYVAVTPGDVISLAFYIVGESDNGAKNNKFEIRAIPLPGPVAQLSW